MAKDDNSWREFVKLIPFRKLTRYDVTNLTFDLIAFIYTLKFTATEGAMHWLAATSTWIAITLITLACVCWASRL